MHVFLEIKLRRKMCLCELLVWPRLSVCGEDRSTVPTVWGAVV